MVRYAVAGMSFLDAELKLEIIEAETWKEAVGKHSVFNHDDDDLSWLSDDLEKAKMDVLDAERTFDIVEV